MNISSRVLTLPLSQADCWHAKVQATAFCDRLCDMHDSAPYSDLSCAQGDRTHNYQMQYNQIRDNLLASIAARYYLKLLGIDSELSYPLSSTSARQLPDYTDTFPGVTGELLLSPSQRLRCLPIIAGAPVTLIPSAILLSSQLITDCLGTIAIQINLPQQEVKILGFLPSAQTSVPLLARSQPVKVSHSIASLQPIAMLINHLSEGSITSLQEWLLGRFVASWQP